RERGGTGLRSEPVIDPPEIVDSGDGKESVDVRVARDFPPDCWIECVCALGLSFAVWLSVLHVVGGG
ncbi:hypothetical protein, partial [Staphylococcus aureus]|uniref:hypothetical protein n=1 Tax=Staphylococcus aureus TaxID=1280 RepID=UPI0038B28709